jgi:signal transduction histidine kinase
MTIESIYPFFIFAGLVIIGVLIYIRYLTRKAIRSVLELFDLNTELDYDLHRFLPEVMRVLKKINIDDLYYDVLYLDSTLVNEKTVSGNSLERDIQRIDYRIKIGIVPRHSRGEQYYLNMIVLEILFFLVEMDVLLRIKVIHEAFYKFSKLQTFILHDAKNLAQFIEFLSYNVRHLETPERQERFISYLKETLPAQSRRGAAIISLLEMEKGATVETTDKSTIDVRASLENLTKHYRLNCTIKGEGSIVAEEYKVISIFDNVLKNIYDKSLDEPDLTCHLDIAAAEDSLRIVISDTGSPIKDYTRLFEPFYSTKRGGLGIGLFQAKNIANAMRGDIRVLPRTTGAAFEIVLLQGKGEE